MVVLKNQNRRSGNFYLRPLCGFGFFSKSDFSAIFFSHFRSSTDSFLVIFCAFKDEIKITTNPKAMP